MLFACFWWVMQNIAFKFSFIYGSPLLLSLVWRNIGHFGINYIVMEMRNPKLKFLDLKLSDINLGLLRGILSTLTSVFSTLGVLYLDLTEVQLIGLSKPFFTMGLNRIYNKEPIKPMHLGCACLCIIGFVFIIQPPFLFSNGEYFLNGGKMLGFFFRLLGNIWNSMADLTIKEIGGKMHAHFIIFFMGMVNVFAFGLGYSWLNEPISPSLSLQGILVLLGICSFIVHYFYSLAYQFGVTNAMVILEFSTIIFSLVADYFLLGRTYNIYSYIGTCIFVTSLWLVFKFK